MLFHDPIDIGYIGLHIDRHLEMFPVQSRDCRRWLTKLFYDAEKKPPSSEALTAAISTLDAMACIEGPMMPVYVRIAGHKNGYTLILVIQDAVRSRLTLDAGRSLIGPSFRSAVPRAAIHARSDRGGSIWDLEEVH